MGLILEKLDKTMEEYYRLPRVERHHLHKLLPYKRDVFLDDSIVVEKFANTREKSFMTMNEAITLSREIAYRVSALSEQPEIIIGIARGGLLLSKVISSTLHIPMETILIQRKGSIIKEKLARIPGLVALSSLWYQIPFLNAPLKFVIDQFSSLATASHQLTPNVYKKHILLVDDAIETGQTLISAREMLSAAGACSIKTAVLAWSNLGDLNNEERIRPDIFIGRRVQHFPWSRNSPYRAGYKSWLEQLHV